MSPGMRQESAKSSKVTAALGSLSATEILYTTSLSWANASGPLDKLLLSQGYSCLWLLCMPFPQPLEVLSPYMYLTWLTSLIWRVLCSWQVCWSVASKYMHVVTSTWFQPLCWVVSTLQILAEINCLSCVLPQYQSTQFRPLLKPPHHLLCFISL